MDANLLKGNLDLILLAALEKDSRYSLEITKEVQDRSDGYFNIKEGSLHTALHHLKKIGCHRWRIARVTMRRGSPVKYHKLTDSGQKELAARRKTFNAFTKAVQNSLGGQS